MVYWVVLVAIVSLIMFLLVKEKNFSVDIAWSTRAECIGFVQYGRDRDNLDQVVVDIVNIRKQKPQGYY